jgi:hypothetical protein
MFAVRLTSDLQADLCVAQPPSWNRHPEHVHAHERHDECRRYGRNPQPTPGLRQILFFYVLRCRRCGRAGFVDGGEGVTCFRNSLADSLGLDLVCVETNGHPVASDVGADLDDARQAPDGSRDEARTVVASHIGHGQPHLTLGRCGLRDGCHVVTRALDGRLHRRCLGALRIELHSNAVGCNVGPDSHDPSQTLQRGRDEACAMVASHARHGELNRIFFFRGNVPALGS